MTLKDLAEYEHLIGGLCGGIASTLVCHPFDLLKIRFSANEGNSLRPQYNGYIDAVRKIVGREGFKGLYQGIRPSVLGAALSWGLYFEWYYWIKQNVFAPSSGLGENVDNVLCGFMSGSAVMCITNPIWLTKTRLCLQYENQATKTYVGMTDCMAKIVKEEGFRGLYKGFLPGILGTSHGAVQFALYNWMKEKRTKMMHHEKSLTHTDYLVCSSVSKVVATTMTFPYQVLRTRMQDHNVTNKTIWSTTTSTLKTEGVAGLWKGCLIANIRQLPAAIITFVTYENVKKILRS